MKFSIFVLLVGLGGGSLVTGMPLIKGPMMFGLKTVQKVNDITYSVIDGGLNAAIDMVGEFPFIGSSAYEVSEPEDEFVAVARPADEATLIVPEEEAPIDSEDETTIDLEEGDEETDDKGAGSFDVKYKTNS